MTMGDDNEVNSSALEQLHNENLLRASIDTLILQPYDDSVYAKKNTMLRNSEFVEDLIRNVHNNMVQFSVDTLIELLSLAGLEGSSCNVNSLGIDELNALGSGDAADISNIPMGDAMKNTTTDKKRKTASTKNISNKKQKPNKKQNISSQCRDLLQSFLRSDKDLDYFDTNQQLDFSSITIQKVMEASVVSESKFNEVKTIMFAATTSGENTANHHKQRYTLALNAVLPPIVFSQKDYLNNRYVDRINMVCVFVFLKLRQLNYDVVLVTKRDNNLLLDMVVQPNAEIVTDKKLLKKLRHFQIKVQFSGTVTTNISRCLPDRKNLIKQSSNLTAELKAFHQLQYNNHLAMTNQMERLVDLRNKIGKLENIRHAMLLLKLWASKNISLCSCESVNHLEFLLVYFLQNKFISEKMSPVQVFQFTLAFIADWLAPLAKTIESSATPSTESAEGRRFETKIFYLTGLEDKISEKEIFESCYPVSLVDGSGVCNLFSSWTLELSLEWYYETKRVCDSKLLDLFSNFLDTRSSTKFDFIMNVVMSTEYDLSVLIESLLQRGLGNRARFIRCCYVGEDNKRSKISSMYTIGINLSSEHNRLVDKGPTGQYAASDNSGAESVKNFQKFWGEVVTLRRFRDGDIVHAINWDDLKLNVSDNYSLDIVDATHRTIMNKICYYVLTRHLKQFKPQVSFPFDNLTERIDYLQKSEILSQEAAKKYLALSSLIRQLDLPLQIEKVNEFVFDTTSVKEEEANCYFSSKIFSMGLSLERSGAWPSKQKAFQAIVKSHLIHMGKLLKGLSPKVLYVQLQEENLLLQYDGLSFRIYFDNLNKFSPSPLDDDQLAIEKRFGSKLKNIRVNCPAYSGCYELFYQFLASQMLSGVMTTRLIQLLVLKSLEFSTHNSNVAFYNLLKLLTTFDFEKKVLIVDLDRVLKVDNVMEKMQFQTNLLDNLCEFTGPKIVCTETVTSGNITSSNLSEYLEVVPEMVLWNRLVNLSNSALKKLNDSKIFYVNSKNLPREYSALLRIDASFIASYKFSSFFEHTNFSNNKYKAIAKQRNRKYANIENDEVVEENDFIHNFHPVDDLLRALRQKFNNYCIFFYNDLCPEVVGLLWRPNIAQDKTQPFTVMHSEYANVVHSSKEDSDKLIVVSKDQILGEIQEMSAGLIEDVKIC